MSAFVCTKNITFSSIVDLAAKYQEINGEKVVDEDEAYRIIEAYAKNKNINLNEMWE